MHIIKTLTSDWYRWLISLALGLVIFQIEIVKSSELKTNSDDSTQGKVTLQQVAKIAINNDFWLKSDRYSQNSLNAQSEFSEKWSDPKVSIGLSNIAADTFNFNQEAMTQFKIGLSQTIPRGDSAALRRRELGLLAEQHPLKRINRKAQVVSSVSQLWLEVFRAQQSIRLIEENRTLFEQLADIAQANYSSTIGKTRQQDIVRAQLELTQLEARLSYLSQHKDSHMQKLNAWLVEVQNFEQSTDNLYLLNEGVHGELPQIEMLQPAIYTSKQPQRIEQLHRLLLNHPAVLAWEKKIAASETAINLAKQSYKPEYSISASYGYRGPNSNSIISGEEQRSDLFSIGLSFDLPIFSEGKQDQQVRSAVNRNSAVKTDKWLLLRDMYSSVQSLRAELRGLMKRQRLFEQKLLPQMHQQAEASLTAYTNDESSFSEVIRARIEQLNASIDSLNINVDIQKKIVQLNYYFMQQPEQIINQRQSVTSRKG